jgi:hypothetical protein
VDTMENANGAAEFGPLQNEIYQHPAGLIPLPLLAATALKMREQTVIRGGSIGNSKAFEKPRAAIPRARPRPKTMVQPKDAATSSRKA